MGTVWDRAQLLITTAWVGSVWTVGYLVAPTLFNVLPQPAFGGMAGMIAGKLFYVEACVSVVCAVLLSAILFYQHRRVCWLVIGMLICTLIGYFALHPFMANLREAGLNDPDIKWQFGVLHSISSGLYLIQSILGGMLVLERLNRKEVAEVASSKEATTSF